AAIIAAGAGDVVGPASAVSGRLTAFDGTTGKLVRQAAAQDVYNAIGIAPRVSGANDVLAGEEGIALQFLSRTAIINDYADVLSDSGRPHDLLTVWRASTATFVGRNRRIQTAAANVMRYDHDPVTGAPRGYLKEGPATNAILWSQEFDNAGWTKVRATVTANA